MLELKRCLSVLAMASVLGTPVIITGCAARVGYGYRIYDPYYRDYHVWNAHERDDYGRWARENHREEHRDFRKAPHRDQEDYWKWHHSHSDNH